MGRAHRRGDASQRGSLPGAPQRAEVVAGRRVDPPRRRPLPLHLRARAARREIPPPPRPSARALTSPPRPPENGLALRREQSRPPQRRDVPPPLPPRRLKRRRGFCDRLLHTPPGQGSPNTGGGRPISSAVSTAGPCGRCTANNGAWSSSWGHVGQDRGPCGGGGGRRAGAPPDRRAAGEAEGDSSPSGVSTTPPPTLAPSLGVEEDGHAGASAAEDGDGGQGASEPSRRESATVEAALAATPAPAKSHGC